MLEYCDINTPGVQLPLKTARYSDVGGFLLSDAMQDRLRGRTLQKLRHRLLSANPLCVMCQAKNVVRLATQLDHIKAIVNGGDARPDDDGYQGLCKPCHDDKTRRDLGQKPRAKFDAAGRVVW